MTSSGRLVPEQAMVLLVIFIFQRKTVVEPAGVQVVVVIYVASSSLLLPVPYVNSSPWLRIPVDANGASGQTHPRLLQDNQTKFRVPKRARRPRAIR
jgi:hypothetical protein